MRPEPAPATLARRAHRLRRGGRLDGAAALAVQALEAMDRSAGDGRGVRAQQRAELLALALGIEVDGGRFDGVVSRADAALAALDAAALSDADAAAAAALARARLQLEAGRVLVMQRDVAAAQARLEAALGAPHRQTLEGETGALVRIRARAMLGALLCMHGRHAEGQQALVQALADAAELSLEEAGPERARVLLSLSASDFEQFRLEAARQWIERAFLDLVPLARAGRFGALADLGRAWHNLGSIHSRAGQLPEALGAYEEALDVYRRAMRHPARRGDAARLRASRANTTMNLGYTCFKTGDHEGAKRHLSTALRRYGSLLGAHPHLRVDAARASINAAHLALHRGEGAHAAAMYRRGLRTLDELAGSTSGAAGDRANALLGLARAELALGRAATSARHFTQAMGALRDLTQQGLLHHANAWLRGWTAQANAWSASAAPARSGARVVTALLDALRSPPLRPAGGSEEPLRVLREAQAAIVRWLDEQRAGPARDAALDRLSEAGLDHLLGCTAQLLSQSSPEWLARHEEPVRAWVSGLGATALSHPSATALLVRWFLSTRGLRGQRIAEAALGGERLSDLRRSLQELGRIEADLLAEAGSEPVASTDILPLGGGTAEKTSSPPVAERAARWHEARRLVETQRARAVDDGLLPAAIRWNVQALSARLEPREALLLVARLDATRLVAVALQAAGDGSLRTRSRVADLPAHLGGRDCAQLLATARLALRQDFAAEDSRHATVPRALPVREALRAAGGDVTALAALREVAEAAIGPLLDTLDDVEACDRVALVPADDLHLVPWRHLQADRRPRLGVRIFPTVGAWVRGRSAAPHAGPWPRWTVAAAAAEGRHPPLRWIAVERALTVRLWSEVGAAPHMRSQEAGEAAGHDALLVMGHGAEPRGHVSPAGLELEDGSLLSAHDIGGGGGFDQVLLSACVSAGTQDAFGEPLGFLSTCFDYRTRFGCGWLTEVPDAAACLFSLAFQFSLREAIAGRGGADWAEVFDVTCRALGRGAWPRGLAAWMKGRRLIDGVELPASPPTALRRVLPWLVAMGR